MRGVSKVRDGMRESMGKLKRMATGGRLYSVEVMTTSKEDKEFTQRYEGRSVRI